ncbi:unnamed protein product, partial [Staurois parvus]
ERASEAEGFGLWLDTLEVVRRVEAWAGFSVDGGGSGALLDTLWTYVTLMLPGGGMGHIVGSLLLLLSLTVHTQGLRCTQPGETCLNNGKCDSSGTEC